MINRLFLYLFLTLLLAATACGQPAQLTSLDELPENPQRIVATNFVILDALLALEAPVIGAPVVDDSNDLPSYLLPYSNAVESIGPLDTPDLDLIAALSPDLILIAEEQRAAPFASRLVDIAPTVAIAGSTNSTWDEAFFGVATVTGRQARARVLLAEWDVRAFSFGQRLDQFSEEVSIVDYIGGAASILPGRSSFAGLIVDEVGLTRPSNQADGEGRASISVRRGQFADLDADAIFLIAPDAAASERLESLPAWRQLRAVQADRVYAVGRHWLGGNLLAAHAILDDVERYLLGNSP